MPHWERESKGCPLWREEVSDKNVRFFTDVHIFEGRVKEKTKLFLNKVKIAKEGACG
jgi:hypothetical protein